MQFVYFVLTAVLCRLKLGQSVTTIPTVGFNVETVKYRNVKFNIWVCLHSVDHAELKFECHYLARSHSVLIVS